MQNLTIEIPALTKELVLSAQSGNRQAIEHVVLNCKGSIFKLVNRLYKEQCQKLSMEVEDLVQEAQLQLCEAIEYYDIEKFHPGGFVNFCIRKVEWRLKDLLKSHRRERALEFRDQIENDVATEALDLPCFVIEKVKAIMAEQPARNSRIWFDYFEQGTLAKDAKSKYGIGAHRCKVIVRKLNDEIIKACA